MRRRTRLAGALDEALAKRRREGRTQRELGQAIAERENQRLRTRHQPVSGPAALRTSAVQWEKRLSAWRTAASTPATADLLLQAVEVVAPGTPRALWLDLWDDARAATRSRDPARQEPDVPETSPDPGIPDAPAADAPAVDAPAAGGAGAGPALGRRGWLLGAAATVAVTAGVLAAGRAWQADPSDGTVREARGTAAPARSSAAPSGVTFIPTPGNWTDWLYGRSLGTTPGAFQQARAQVHGLERGDTERAVGFRMRSGVDRYGRPMFIIVRISGVEWQIELQYEGPPGGWVDHGPFTVRGDGVLDVTISATDRVVITFGGERIADVQLPADQPVFTGREIFPAAFQGAPPWAEMQDIRTNAGPPSATRAGPVRSADGPPG